MGWERCSYLSLSRLRLQAAPGMSDVRSVLSSAALLGFCRLVPVASFTEPVPTYLVFLLSCCPLFFPSLLPFAKNPPSHEVPTAGQPPVCPLTGCDCVCVCVAVIPDSLQATAMPQTLHRVEQDPLELTCEVATETFQHSHLSVAWLRQRGSEKPVEVIALSRDFMLHSSSEYAQRQSLGEVRLDKLGSSTFRLTVFHLQPSDQGEFYCEAAEWIQDPDGSWYAMTRKRSEGTVVTVQPTGQSLLSSFSTWWRGLSDMGRVCSRLL